MAGSELLQMTEELHNLVTKLSNGYRSNLENTLQTLEAWRSKNDNDSQPMTMEEMQADQRTSDVEDASEIIWELEYFLRSMESLDAAITKLHI